MKLRQLLAEKELVPVRSIYRNATLRETAKKLIQYQIGALVITDDNDRMVGIVSERHLIHVVANYNADAVEKPVSQVMTRSVITCGPDDEISYILGLMKTNTIRHIPVLDQGKLVNMVSIRELTTAYELLQIEANTDPLTKLFSRRRFLEVLEVEFTQARWSNNPFAVAMIDIDEFKRVNDAHGHDAGDRVLRATAAILTSEFRTSYLVGRLGGEEFAVVFPKTDLAEAKISCNRLLAAIQENSIPVNGKHISVTVSIGLAKASSETLDGSDILIRADELLYNAKTGGKNRLVIEEE